MIHRLALCVAAVLMATSCGRRETQPEPSESLTFEQLDDTTGLNRGQPIVRTFEPYRMENGAIRVRGKLDFPDGTMLQISVYQAGQTTLLTRVQFEVQDGRFDTPPIIGERGPLPRGDYRFLMHTYFDSAWQPPAVMEETRSGRNLRGPGMTRGANGETAYTYDEDHTL